MSYGAAAVVVAAIAGIATVHAFAPPSAQGMVSSKFEKQVKQEHLSAVRGSGMTPSLEVNRPPVPILPMHRPPNGRSTGAPGNGVSRDDSAVATNSVADESIVRTAVERDGYKGVHSLRRRLDGLWNARALRGSVEIEVTVDSAGNVAVH